MYNKTIRMDPDSSDGKRLLAQCRQVSTPLSSLEEILDSTVFGDTFSVLPLLPPESVDLLIVDPPYNLTKQYGQSRFRAMDKEDYEAFTKCWLSLALPLLKPTGSLYVCCDWYSGLTVGPLLDEMTVLRNRITWQREKGRGASSNWKNGMEDIWFATKGSRYTFHLDAVKLRRRVLAPYRKNGEPKDWQDTPSGRFRDTCPSNFWDDITVPFWSMPENTEHPAQKPEKLLAKLILASSDPGDVILDPFAGSGSTSVTAKKLGRRYIGIEKEPLYCCLCEKRLEEAQKGGKIQGYENGVFWERNSGRIPREDTPAREEILPTEEK